MDACILTVCKRSENKQNQILGSLQNKITRFPIPVYRGRNVCSYLKRCVFACLFLNLLLFRQAGTQHVNQTTISDTHSSARLIYMIPLNVAAPLIFYTDMYSVSFTIQGFEATSHKGKLFTCRFPSSKTVNITFECKRNLRSELNKFILRCVPL